MRRRNENRKTEKMLEVTENKAGRERREGEKEGRMKGRVEEEGKDDNYVAKLRCCVLVSVEAIHVRNENIHVYTFYIPFHVRFFQDLCVCACSLNYVRTLLWHLWSYSVGDICTPLKFSVHE